MGGEANPGKYKLRNKLAKVYRKTFAIQKNSLAEKKQEWEKAPPYLGRNCIKDVTDEYVPVENVKLELTEGIPDSTNFVYICVFNTGEWKAIDFTRFHGTKAYFTKLGLGIAYLPAFYYDEKILPAGNALVLTDSGKIENKIPETKIKINLKLYSTTKRVTKLSTDFIEEAHFNIGKKYTLFFWNNKWEEVGAQKATGGPLIFNNVPSNAFYWLVEDGSRKEERIFTIDEQGNQVWW